MYEQKTLSIIIPCYNEELGLPNLKAQLQPVLDNLKHSTELIFVDDGSTDRTNELLHELFPNTTIIKHEKNMNLGAALKTGFNAAKGDLIAAWDSDCTYPPHLLPEMLNLLDDETSIVTVSPLHPEGKIENVPPYRIFLSKTISQIYKILLNSNIYTHGAMVRLYKREVIDNIKFQSDDFLSVTELLVKAKLKNYKIKELPTTVKVRQFGTSKMKLAKTIKSHLGLISKIVLYKTLGKEI
jgi:dolichol-phosphate mannosyltransferase